MPIDRGIVETVTILRLMKFNTSSSCAGHVRRFMTEPYVRVQSDKAKEYAARAGWLDNPTKANPEYRRLRKKAVQLSLLEARKLISRLDNFYESRPGVPYSQRLTVRFLPPIYLDLRCQGAEMMHIGGREVKREVMARAQAEMREFAEHLKTIYFLTPVK
jgi:hypothetical protein